MERIDAHHHFWRLGKFKYWDMQPELLHNFGPDELTPLRLASGVDRTVLVQTIASLEETDWFLQLADADASIAGVVGWIDLEKGEVAQQLERLPARKLLGIRHNVHDEPDDGWLLRDSVNQSLGELARRGMPYDLLIKPRHLPAALQVAEKHPDLKLVIDHLGKPDIARQGWDDWAPGMKALARLPQVSCKLSGMITEADWQRWRSDDLRRYIDFALEHFGPNRLMFGSDWPVCLLAGSYQNVVAALADNLVSLSAAEQVDVWGGSARRFYAFG